jgi:hypothetical protein
VGTISRLSTSCYLANTAKHLPDEADYAPAFVAEAPATTHRTAAAVLKTNHSYYHHKT